MSRATFVYIFIYCRFALRAFSKDEKTKQPPLIVKRLNGYDIWIVLSK